MVKKRKWDIKLPIYLWWSRGKQKLAMPWAGGWTFADKRTANKFPKMLLFTSTPTNHTYYYEDSKRTWLSNPKHFWRTNCPKSLQVSTASRSVKALMRKREKRSWPVGLKRLQSRKPHSINQKYRKICKKRTQTPREKRNVYIYIYAYLFHCGTLYTLLLLLLLLW